MGIYDREYYRDDEPPAGINLSGSRTMTVNLVIANVLVYLVCVLITSPRIVSYLQLDASAVVKPWLWYQFVSYGFVHSTQFARHIIFNMIGLWIFGNAVEGVYGRMEILRIYLVTVVLGGLIWALRIHFLVEGENFALVGASGAVTAIVLLFCLKFPTRTIYLMLVLPVPAWLLGLMIILGDLWGLSSMQEGRIAFDVHLVGTAFAICYYRFGWNLGNWTPKWFAFGRMFKPRPSLRVHAPPVDGDAEDAYEHLDEEADRVLAKLHQQGEESLSPQERKVLEAYSRRMQQKHR